MFGARDSSRGISSQSTSSRLRGVNESAGSSSPKPPIPTKSALRQSASEQAAPHVLPAAPTPQAVQSHKNSYDTGRTAPPAYGWNSGSVTADAEDSGTLEGEKLAAHRRAGGYKRKSGTAASWPRRTWLIAAIVALVVIALIVGLSVGLTVGRKRSGSRGQTPGASISSDSGQQPFPIGQYSMITTLRNVNTSCTSDADTWNCFPYQVYDPANAATADSSRTTFDWLIANSSSSYATIGSGATADEGEPANLTISSTSNPFSLTFDPKPLTYISPSSNSSSARYTFSFEMDKAFNPPVSLSSNNVATQCYFNQTTLTGTLYLSAPRTYLASSNSTGTLQWPYAIEITQSSPGGTDIPACYEFVQGAVGARITTGLTPQSADTQCLCDYRNY